MKSPPAHPAKVSAKTVRFAESLETSMQFSSEDDAAICVNPRQAAPAAESAYIAAGAASAAASSASEKANDAMNAARKAKSAPAARIAASAAKAAARSASVAADNAISPVDAVEGWVKAVAGNVVDEDGEYIYAHANSQSSEDEKEKAKIDFKKALDDLFSYTTTWTWVCWNFSVE